MKIKITNPIKTLKEKYYSIGHQEGLNNGKKTGYDVGYEKGLEIGFYKGKESNHNKVDLYLDILNKLFENQEKEIKELREKINSQPKYNNTKTQIKSDKEILDDHMLYFKSIFSIVDSSFFGTVLYQSATSKTIKDYVDFIDYLEHSIDIKNTYPETVKLLPTLKNAYEKLYQNKLAVEEAEKLI